MPNDLDEMKFHIGQEIFSNLYRCQKIVVNISPDVSSGRLYNRHAASWSGRKGSTFRSQDCGIQRRDNPTEQVRLVMSRQQLIPLIIIRYGYANFLSSLSAQIIH